MNWSAVFVSVKLASVVTVLLLVICLPVAWGLARWKHWSVGLLEAASTLPMVLPPTVLGYYLLVAFAPSGWLGATWSKLFDSRLAFSFTGLVLASMVYSLPFVLQPLLAGFRTLDTGILDLAQLFGFSSQKTLLRVVIPARKQTLVSAAILGFAHTMGEFGVVLMVGGNIPGKTRVLSVDIYEKLQLLDYDGAAITAGALLLFSMLVLGVVYSMNRRSMWLVN